MDGIILLLGLFVLAIPVSIIALFVGQSGLRRRVAELEREVVRLRAVPPPVAAAVASPPDAAPPMPSPMPRPSLPPTQRPNPRPRLRRKPRLRRAVPCHGSARAGTPPPTCRTIPCRRLPRLWLPAARLPPTG